MSKLGPFKFGDGQAELVPHYLPGVGARMFLHIDGAATPTIKNITAAEVRLLSDILKLAACEAEALEQRAHRQHLLIRPQTSNEQKP